MLEASWLGSWSESAMGDFAWLSVKTALLLAAGCVAGISLRRGSARQRHTLWSVTLIGVWLMTALGGLLPQWRWESLAHMAGGVLASPSAPVVGGESGAAGADGLVRMSPDGFPLRPSPELKEVPSAEIAGLRELEAVSVQPEWAFFSARLVLGFWVSGFGLTCVWLGVGLHRVRRITMRAEAVTEAELVQLMRRLTGEFGLSRRVRLLMSRETRTPVTWGWFRPAVIVPVSAGGWSLERWRVVLLHEIAHIRRSDWPVQMIAHFVCAVHWFNPMAWWAHGRLIMERERACDEEVLSRGLKPSQYATHLLEIARQMCDRGSGSIVALSMARRVSHLEWRLRSILAHRPVRRRGVVWPAMLVCSGVLILGLATLEPVDGMVAAGARSPAPSMAQAMPLIRAGAWEQAITVLEDVIRLHPNHYQAWFFLGYALHYNGQVNQGIHATLRASEAEGLRGVSLYNVACANVILGRDAEALQYLRRSFNAGFAGLNHLRMDPDLDSIRQLPEFQVLVAEQEAILRGRMQNGQVQDGAIQQGPSAGDGAFALPGLVNLDAIENTFRIEIDGWARIEDGVVDVQTLTPGSSISMESVSDGVQCRLLIEADQTGRLNYDWAVDGSRRVFDGEARRWMALMLRINARLNLTEDIRNHISVLEARVERIQARRSAIKVTLRGASAEVDGDSTREDLEQELNRLDGQLMEAQRLRQETQEQRFALEQSVAGMFEELRTSVSST